MSLEANPNINAAGLVVRVMEAVAEMSRGKASGHKALTPQVTELAAQFCLEVSEELDREFGS